MSGTCVVCVSVSPPSISSFSGISGTSICSLLYSAQHCWCMLAVNKYTKGMEGLVCALWWEGNRTVCGSTYV